VKLTVTHQGKRPTGTVVLDLVGPAEGTGIGFTFRTDPGRAAWRPSVAQNGTDLPVALNQVLAEIRLDLAAGAQPGPVTLVPGKCRVLSPAGIRPTTVAVGTLVAQETPHPPGAHRG